MRCLACNVELDDHESTTKNPETGEFLDLCNTCLGAVRQAQFELEIKPEIVYNVTPKDTQGTSEEPTE
jgi:hypothetical protein